MSTFYLDPVNGSDSSSGADWANAWKSLTTGATSGRVAAGDTIRVAKSDPGAQSIGSATWTTGPSNANLGITSSTNATPIVVTKNSHGIANGDVVFITSHSTNTNANGWWYAQNVTANTLELAGSVGNGVGGATGQMYKNPMGCVQIASALTLDIVHDNAGWTTNDVSKCTVTPDTSDYRHGNRSHSFGLLTPAGVEQLAYFNTSSSLNLSSYNQVSFWVKSSVALAAGDLQLQLCSGTNGSTPRNTISLPAVYAGVWQVVTIDTGSALYNGIQSVGLYQAVDKGALTLKLDNIIACGPSGTASSISLKSMLTKNSSADGMTGTEGFWAIRSIESAGKILVLDGSSTLTINLTAYWGSTETVTTYRRETMMQAEGLVAQAGQVGQGNRAGTAATPVTLSGGWDTGSNTRTSCTIFDGLNGYGIGMTAQYWILDRMNYTRYYQCQTHSAPIQITNCNTLSLGNSRNFYVSGQSPWTNVSILNVLNGHDIACYINGNGGTYSIGSIIGTDGQGQGGGVGSKGVGLRIDGPGFQQVFNLGKVALNVCGIYSNYNSGTVLANATTTSNVSAGICTLSSGVRTFNCTFNDTVYILNNTQDLRVYSQKDGTTAGNHKIYSDGCTCTLQTTTQQTGAAWDMALTSTRTAAYPFRLSLFRCQVKANKTVTITAQLKLSSGTNVAARIIVPAYQVAGVTTDQTASKTADTNWQTLTIPAFTSTEDGCIECFAEGWYLAGAGDVYVDQTFTCAIGA